LPPVASHTVFSFPDRHVFPRPSRISKTRYVLRFVLRRDGSH
jgi:hypothetical protein